MSVTPLKTDAEYPPRDGRHGSYAGWNQHRVKGTPPCDPCLRAAKEYMRRWRRKTGRHPRFDTEPTGNPLNPESSGARFLTVMEMGTLTGKLGDFW